MKTIIVPTDFSACADNALHYAIDVARLLEAKLEVVYVHRPHLLIGADPLVTPQVVLPVPDEVFTKMGKVEKELANYAPLKFECIIKEGFLDERLEILAEKKEAVMIVMGTAGAYDATSSLFGSNTSRLVERKKVPILAVPDGFTGRLKPKASFVFATDFKDINNWEVMNSFKVLAQKLHAKINVFYVKEPYMDKEENEFEQNTFDEFKEYYEGVELELHHSYKKDIVHAIESFALSNGASLVMMIAHDRGWLDSLFHKSVTKEMSLYSHLPFLSLPDSHAEVNKSASVNYW
jgi:nucleotide-binding universal stress UspA family protein